MPSLSPSTQGISCTEAFLRAVENAGLTNRSEAVKLQIERCRRVLTAVDLEREQSSICLQNMSSELEQEILCPICWAHRKSVMLLPSRRFLCIECSKKITGVDEHGRRVPGWVPVNRRPLDPFTRQPITHIVPDALKYAPNIMASQRSSVGRRSLRVEDL